MSAAATPDPRPAGSNERAEHACLVRLLACSERAVSSADGISAEELPRFRRYVAELRSRLDAAGPALRGRAALERRVGAVEDMVERADGQWTRPAGPIRRRLYYAVPLDDERGEVAVQERARRHARARRKRELLEPAAAKERARPRPKPKPKPAPRAEAEDGAGEAEGRPGRVRRELLEGGSAAAVRERGRGAESRHEERHAQQVHELNEMVGKLKREALGIRRDLADDAAVVDRLDDAVSSNQAMVGGLLARVNQHLASSRGTTLISFCVLVTVGAVFWGTFVFMKIFRKPVA